MNEIQIKRHGSETVDLYYNDEIIAQNLFYLDALYIQVQVAEKQLTGYYFKYWDTHVKGPAIEHIIHINLDGSTTPNFSQLGLWKENFEYSQRIIKTRLNKS
ncbi:MAG: hypothetical protein ACK52I_07695 [Pseudomonadota bacterium]